MFINTRFRSDEICETFGSLDIPTSEGKAVRLSLSYLICIPIIVSGCASITGAPKPPISVDNTITRYSNDLEKLAENPPNDCDGVKQGINKALTVMDLRYSEFIDDISVENKTKATTADFMLIGLGLAGTAVGGAGAKTIFSALSTAVAAANTSIDKNYFYEKTLPALVSKMNADRKEQQLLMIQRLASCKKGIDYSWFEAVHDLNDYYSAGTLLGAIASVSKDAGVKQAKSEDAITDLLTLKPSANTPDKQRLHVYFLKDKANPAKILRCWKSVGTTRPDAFEFASDLFDEPFASDIPAVMRCLEKEGPVP
jgi:hypothetical protein